MSTLIHVGSSFRARTFLGPAVLSVCLLLGGALLMAAQADGAGIMLVTGATGLLATLLWGIAIHARRAKVEISPSGFRFHDRWGVREFFDEQVMCLGERVEQEYSQGEWKGTRRRWELCFHSDSGPLRVELVHPLPAGAVDPFRPLIDRLHEQLYQQGHDALAAGLPFEGEHWTLSPQELTVNRRGTEQSLRLEELSAAEVVDNRLCVWRCGGERPALEIPIEWANVATLGRLLKERVIADPIDGGRNDGNDLGRILFERGPGRAVTWLLWLAPLKGVGVVVGSLVATWWGRPEWLTIGGVTALVLFLLWGVALSQATRLTCHERGAAWRWLWRVRRLMFANVANVTFQTVRQYVKGVYSGTTFTLSLEGEEEGQPVKLRFARTLRSADPELEHVRDHVSRLIATRMAQSLAEGQRVAWTSRLALLRDGLEYRAPSLLAKKPPVTYRYDQLTGIDASGELFQAWVGGRRTPAIRESTGDPNFYPGYLLLVRILAARKPTELRQTVSPL